MIETSLNTGGQQTMTVQQNTIIKAFAEKYDIPIMGVNMLGGKPYPNAMGLTAKAKKLGLKSISIDIEKAASKDDLSAIVKAKVKLKDGSEYEDYGFGSKESIKMSSLHNIDFITMTTITRAKNRALRGATGFGMVSFEEIKDAHELYNNGFVPEIEQSTNLDNIEVKEVPKQPEVIEREVEEVAVEKKQQPSITTVPKAIEESQVKWNKYLADTVVKIKNANNLTVLKTLYDEVENKFDGGLPEMFAKAFREKEEILQVTEEETDKTMQTAMNTFYQDLPTK